MTFLSSTLKSTLNLSIDSSIPADETAPLLTIPTTPNRLIHNAAFQAGLVKSSLVTVDGSDLVDDFLPITSTSFNAVGTGAFRPKYFDGTVEGINGNPAIKWSGAHVLNYGDIAGFDPSTSDWTIFMVMKVTANSAIKVALTFVGNLEEFIRVESADTDWDTRIGAPPIADIASFDSNTPVVIALRIEGTNLKGFKDGTETLDTTKTPLSRTSNLLLGARSTSGLNPINGFIGEIAFYDRALSSSELTDHNTYFSAKWGTP